MPRKKEKLDFEKSLAKLESIVEKMDHGNLSLEDSLTHFEEGVALAKTCQKALTEAEQRVEILVNKHQQESLEAFDTDDIEDES